MMYCFLIFTEEVLPVCCMEQRHWLTRILAIALWSLFFFSWRRGSLIVFSCYSANLVFVSTGEPTLLILLGVFF